MRLQWQISRLLRPIFLHSSVTGSSLVGGLMLLSLPGLAGEGWLAHLTPAEGAIQSEMVLSNLSLNPEDVQFFDQAGNLVLETRLAGGETRVLGAEAFTNGRPGHLFFRSGPLTSVSVRYSMADDPYSILVPGNGDLGSAYRFSRPGDSELWLGLALVNTGHAMTDIQIRFFSADGALLRQTGLTQRLGPRQKLLTLLPDTTGGESSYAAFEVLADQPIAPVVLYGGKAPPLARLLGSIAPEANLRDRIFANASGGITGESESVLIENGYLEFRGSRIRLEEEPTIWEELSRLGFENLSLDIEPRGDICCDFRTYSATMVRGKARNSIRFMDEDVHENLPAALEIIAAIFHYAEEVTGLESSVF